ncbi:MAG: hypothetical protein HQL45_10885 [Alphaproteobacteria bacterium]|nr:hypothetical protein [Alphaproteobacteria bacterium]
MTAAAILKLQHAGFTNDQVEALAEFMDERAATREDLVKTEANLKTAMSDMEVRIIKWVIGVGFAQGGLIMAFIKLTQHL